LFILVLWFEIIVKHVSVLNCQDNERFVFLTNDLFLSLQFEIETRLMYVLVTYEISIRSHLPRNHTHCWPLNLAGILMLIGWMMCASTALIMAKYYKPMWPNSRLCREKVWFAVSLSFERKKTVALSVWWYDVVTLCTTKA